MHCIWEARKKLLPSGTPENKFYRGGVVPVRDLIVGENLYICCVMQRVVLLVEPHCEKNKWKLELYENNVLVTQKLVLEELGQGSVDLEGNSGKDAFLLSQPLNDCFSFTLKMS